MATSGRIAVLTQEERLRGLRNGLWNPERQAAQKLTRTWYKNLIFTIVTGEQECSVARWKAVEKYGDLMG